MTSPVDIKGLKQKRTTFKGQLTRFQTYLDEFNGRDISALKLRTARIEEMFKQFDIVQTELEIADETTDHSRERELVEEIAFQHIARAHDLLLNVESTASTSSPQNTPGDQRQPLDSSDDVWLPKIKLPTFDGTYEDWPSFADQFKSAVDHNSRISECRKLLYLRSCLTGDAARSIETIENSAANYAVAWSILQREYDQPAIIVGNHLKALFEITACQHPSQLELRRFLNTVESRFRALQSMEQPSIDTILIHLFKTKLDKQTVTKWKERTHSTSFPTLAEFFEFLAERCKVLEPPTSEPKARAPQKSAPQKSASRQPQNQTVRGTYSSANTATAQQSYSVQSAASCGICKGSHYTQYCEQLNTATVAERSNIVKKAKLCLNCLRDNHTINDCRASMCKKCHKKHHTLLHYESTTPQNTQSDAIPALTASIASQVILSTAIVDMADADGKFHPCRILLDTGSQSHFITEEFAKRLNLAQYKTNIPVTGITQTISYIRARVNAQIKSRHGQFTVNASFLVLPKITDTVPSRRIDTRVIKIPDGVRLADPQYFESGKIDALLGAELFLNLLCVGQFRVGNSITLQKTRLGWIIAGKIQGPSPTAKLSCNLATDLDSQINRFWEIEEIPFKKSLSLEEQACEDHYVRTTTRDPNSGKYTVRLPFNAKVHSIGESHTNAVKRFHALENSLNRNPDRKTLYVNFMREYEQLEHMSEITNPNHEEGYYLPHHAVFKQSSLTTKLRVVFDGSARSSTSISLNHALLVGPTIQEDLLSLMIKFRSHAHVLTADIAKMYRQILVHQDDRKFQKIVWREDSQQPLKTYNLNTVTYGTSSASFLAIRSLYQLASDEQNTYPLAAKILKEDLYVDDLITGAQTYQEAEQIRDELVQITRSGGLQLRQWSSNTPGLIGSLEPSSNDIHFTSQAGEKTTALGTGWNPRLDCIYYTVKPHSSTGHVTKRVILSRIAQLFDPLGLLGPVMLKAKIIMQALWSSNVTWDESIPAHIHTAWSEYQAQLPLLEQISFNRKIIADNPINVQIHGFCDASEKGYGACIYIRSTSTDDISITRVLCSKSRVAPLKTQSIPRLELCAALLLAKLYKITTQALRRMTIDTAVFWSDSMIALQWINTSPNTLKTFVANRVSEIQTNTDKTQWRHVSSQDNPADILSRGASPSELLENSLWLNGPSWLTEREQQWPYTEIIIGNPPEQKPIITLSISSPSDDLLTRFSCFTKLKRITAYCLRFISNLRLKTRNAEPLTPQELHTAGNRIIKCVQHTGFTRELAKLKAGETDSRLLPLSPFVDDEGILRVGGRLARSNLPYRSKHPALLPSTHPVTKLIIRYEHEKSLHAGVLATLASLRRKYWITNGRRTVKGVLGKCMTCYRAKPSLTEYPMGMLPTSRVTQNRPFTHTGIDYCGPLFIKEKRHRNRNKLKTYVAIFVCFATKAVHIELVSDLTTEAFLSALKRFIARRGKPSDIYSDNATNFVGANRELKEIVANLHSKACMTNITHALANEGINWHFIPPRSPNFGGLWEAAVKSAKHHVVRVLGNTLLTFEALATCLTEIEAILNSRPLTPLSSDPNDLQPLTPGHFLIGDSLTCAPEHDLAGIPTGRLSSWQHAQQLKQHFWSRWHKEYLHELLVRKGWHTGSPQTVNVGDLVTLIEDNTTSMRWPLGRITATHPGADGIVRVVSVKTNSGEYKRNLRKLSPLPL